MSSFLSHLSPLQLLNFGILGLLIVLFIYRRILRPRAYKPPSELSLNLQLLLVFIIGILLGTLIGVFLPTLSRR